MRRPGLLPGESRSVTPEQRPSLVLSFRVPSRKSGRSSRPPFQISPPLLAVAAGVAGSVAGSAHLFLRLFGYHPPTANAAKGTSRRGKRRYQTYTKGTIAAANAIKGTGRRGKRYQGVVETLQKAASAWGYPDGGGSVLVSRQRPAGQPPFRRALARRPPRSCGAPLSREA